MARILVDMDNVIYDIDEPWIKAHNRDFPDHVIIPAHYTIWNRQQLCDDANCNADIYSYLDTKSIWNDGPIIDGAYTVLEKWHKEGHELAVVTAVGNSVSPNRKVSWLRNNVPFIDNIFLTYGRNKDWIHGDFLIDDAIHNLDKFTGIRINYAQPWNADTKHIRACNWNEVDRIVRRGLQLMDKGYTELKFIEQILKVEHGITNN